MSAFIEDTRFGPDKPRLLLYSSCVAEQVRHWLISTRLGETHSIDVLLIHVLECDGVNDIADSPHRSAIERADFIGTNCFSPRWANLGLHRVHELRKPSSKLFTWVPPNFAALWPVVEHFGEHGVMAMIKDGAKCGDIIEAFKTMRFNPMFAQRWTEQTERIAKLESTCDIKLSDFVIRNRTWLKLWFTENHPTYHIVAHIGMQLANLIGEDMRAAEDCASVQHDALGIWNTWPETEYEFNHFGFAYPMRYETTPNWGGLEWYHGLIHRIFDRVASGQ